MKLHEITPESMTCVLGSCPAIFKTDRNTYVIIGKQLTADQIEGVLKSRIGVGETAIEFPEKLLSQIYV